MVIVLSSSIFIVAAPLSSQSSFEVIENGSSITHGSSSKVSDEPFTEIRDSDPNASPT